MTMGAVRQPNVPFVLASPPPKLRRQITENRAALGAVEYFGRSRALNDEKFLQRIDKLTVALGVGDMAHNAPFKTV
jgi:hypothetical protein